MPESGPGTGVVTGRPVQRRRDVRKRGQRRKWRPVCLSHERAAPFAPLEGRCRWRSIGEEQ